MRRLVDIVMLHLSSRCHGGGVITSDPESLALAFAELASLSLDHRLFLSQLGQAHCSIAACKKWSAVAIRLACEYHE